MIRRLVPILILTLSLHAQSRYLSDSAGGPIKWEAWGSRALDRAKKENRPIFLSVGFASSFEGFRMQREAFVDAQVAQILNNDFVPVLLDRLEYPEIAETYETLARSMGHTAAAPMLMALTPSLEPFAVSGPLATGDLKGALATIANRWTQQRDAVNAEAHQNVMKARARLSEIPLPAERRPNAHAISLLIRTKQTTAAFDALRKLASSALHDQLGGGFHRAARDDAWRQPYFEKMLADQALLAIAYLEAWQATRDPEMERLARETLDAAIRDLYFTPGAFEASQDAHSLVPAQGPEFWNGAFYLWRKDEIARFLGHDPARKVFSAYGISGEGRNTLYAADPVALKDPALPPLLAKLLDLRQKRPQPFRERNLISGLNGLMISALARGGAVSGEKKYLDVALMTAQVVTKNLWNAPKKTLLHSAGVEALAEDYAMLAQGLLDLFEATYDPKWLDLAIALQQRQDQLFWDENAGRYTTGASVPQVVSGFLAERDDETPAANSVAAMNLLRLAMLTGNEAWRNRPAKIFQTFGTSPQLPQLAIAQAAAASEMKIVAVTGDMRRKPTGEVLHAIHQRWEPLRFVLFVPSKGAARDRMLKALPFTGGLAVSDDPEVPFTHECSGGECRRR